jgi:hypothetical protein
VLEASFSDRRRGLAKFEEAPPPEPVRVGAETP